MGQQEIYDYLKEKKGQRFCADQLAKLLDRSQGSIRTCLMKIRKAIDRGSITEIQYKKVPYAGGSKGTGKYWKYVHWSG